MAKYSYNGDSKLVFASMSNLNASYKDLGAVCTAIRYKPVSEALSIIEAVSSGKTPILYKKHNKRMGSRHELGGKKGRTPIKCSLMVRRVLLNALGNATQKNYSTDELYVAHAAANKVTTLAREPPKGARFVPGNHTYGFLSVRRSNLELARVEIGLASEEMIKNDKNLARKMRFAKGKQKQADSGKDLKIQNKNINSASNKANKAEAKPAKKENAEKQEKKAQVNK
ncbi:MAG: uL22 family ribosomal protein [Candidatus Micrarchaeia archaeon]